MKKLKAVIVDDELHARENLKYLLQDYCPEINVIGMAADPGEAIALVAARQPDLIFLDICMPSGTEGFEMLDAIPDKQFQVVFVTAFKDNAIRALNANAVRHLQKPVDVDDLISVVESVIDTYELFCKNRAALLNYVRSLESLSQIMYSKAPPSMITIQHSDGFRIVDQKDLMYLEGEGGHTSIVFTDGTKYVDMKPIGVYESVLDESRFFRIHKTHIVNLRCVKEFVNDKGHFVVMANNSRLPVSRMRLADFKVLLQGTRGTQAI